MKRKYIIEVRNADGSLASWKDELPIRTAHPYLFSKPDFSADDLTYWVSFREGRNNPVGPVGAYDFLSRIGVTVREKTW